jgi:hypothetical protein
VSRTPPSAYGSALDALAAAVHEARSLAEILEYAAGLLRGRPPDPDDTPLDQCPGGARVLAVLARRDRALADAERAWDALDPSLRPELPAPGELLEEAGCA